MPYDYDNIVHEFFEELKPLFVNYLHKNFTLTYDEINDIYTNVWMYVRRNILNNRVTPNTNWKGYILKLGWRQADKAATRRRHDIDSYDDETFNRAAFEKEYADEWAHENSIYADPDLQAVLAAELSYIPDPCNKILKLYYFDELSMRIIADAMNYSSANSAHVVRKRCFEKLKTRVRNAVRRLGILDD